MTVSDAFGRSFALRDKKRAVLFGLTRGEIVMVAAVSALVLLAGQIPRITRALDGDRARERGRTKEREGGD